MVVGGFRSFLLLVTTARNASYKSTRNLSSKWGF